VIFLREWSHSFVRGKTSAARLALPNAKILKRRDTVLGPASDCSIEGRFIL